MTPLGRFLIYYIAKKSLYKKTRGLFPAPFSALKSAVYGFSRSIKKGLKREATDLASKYMRGMRDFKDFMTKMMRKLV